MAKEVKKPIHPAEPVKTEAAKKKESQKGKEPWRHKATTGKAHPDNKPPMQIVAEPSPENKKKFEDSINAEREKTHAIADWRDLEGGVPADESKAAKPEYPVGPKPAANP
jgi:hypothetical protein